MELHPKDADLQDAITYLLLRGAMVILTDGIAAHRKNGKFVVTTGGRTSIRDKVRAGGRVIVCDSVEEAVQTMCSLLSAQNG